MGRSTVNLKAADVLHGFMVSFGVMIFSTALAAVSHSHIQGSTLPVIAQGEDPANLHGHWSHLSQDATKQVLFFPTGRVLRLHLQLRRGRASLCSTQGGWLPAQPLLGIHHAGKAHLHPRVLPNETSNHGLHQRGNATPTFLLLAV